MKQEDNEDLSRPTGQLEYLSRLKTDGQFQNELRKVSILSPREPEVTVIPNDEVSDYSFEAEEVRVVRPPNASFRLTMM